MLTKASKLAKIVGLVAGMLLIGGSMVGGIALAAGTHDDPAAVTGPAAPPGEPNHDGDDTDGQSVDDQEGQLSDDSGRGGDDCAEDASSDDDCAADATTTPAPGQSPDGDDDSEDDESEDDSDDD